MTNLYPVSKRKPKDPSEKHVLQTISMHPSKLEKHKKFSKLFNESLSQFYQVAADMRMKKERLYFTDLTKALYMMKEFGVTFIAGDQGYYNYENCLSYTLEHLTNRAKYYVASESEYLFEAKEGDIGIRTDSIRLAIGEATGCETFQEDIGNL